MRKEIKIALVAIIGIVILFFGMNFLKGMSLLADKNTYYATFENIDGLAVSNPIFVGGYQVGVVKDIHFDYTATDGIVVRFNLDEGMRLPAGTVATIASDFMGNVKMNLLLGESAKSNRQFLSQGDTLSGAVANGLMTQAAAMLPKVEQMLSKLDSILTSLNKLASDPAIAQSLHNVEAITNDLTTSTRQLNTLLAETNGRVPALLDKADGTLDNARKLSGDLAAADISSTLSKVDQTIANVEALTAKLNDKNGTLGLLMNDPTLFNRLDGTLNSAEQLLTDLRQHPKRYINVSVFGKKDKQSPVN